VLHERKWTNCCIFLRCQPCTSEPLPHGMTASVIDHCDRCNAISTAACVLDKINKQQITTVMVATIRIAAEHGSFNRIRQVAPTCAVIVPPKRHLDRFSRFCRAHACDQQHTDLHTDRATSRHAYRNRGIAGIQHYQQCSVGNAAYKLTNWTLHTHMHTHTHTHTHTYRHGPLCGAVLSQTPRKQSASHRFDSSFYPLWDGKMIRPTVLGLSKNISWWWRGRW